MISAIDSLEKGEGLYSFHEVADYLGILPQTLRSWFTERGRSGRLLTGAIQTDREGGAWLSFNDFVQAFVINQLKKHGVKPKVIREAISEAKEKYSLPYPFSYKGHKVYVEKGGRRGMLILPEGQSNVRDLTGKLKGHESFTELIDPYIERLEFDDKGTAQRFIVFEKTFPNGSKKRVIMDPHVNFGEPTVEGTPYRAITLKEAAEAEGGADQAAAIYIVEPNDVIVAIEALTDGLAIAA
jgi:uncharacterized protein (DUF433 family)/DNA-binding transcriptional MerR regulator